MSWKVLEEKETLNRPCCHLEDSKHYYRLQLPNNPDRGWISPVWSGVDSVFLPVCSLVFFGKRLKNHFSVLQNEHSWGWPFLLKRWWPPTWPQTDQQVMKCEITCKPGAIISSPIS